MKRTTYLFIILLLLKFGIVLADTTVVEIITKEVVSGIPQSMSFYSLYIKDNKIFFSQNNKCTLVNLDNYSVSIVNPDTSFFRVLGEYGDKLITNNRWSSDKHWYQKFYIYNPQTSEIEPFEVPKEIIGSKEYINYFINNQFFITIGEGYDGTTSFLYDFAAKKYIKHFPSRFSDLTPDRIHSLWVEYSDLKIYNHATKEWSSTSRIGNGESDLIYFLNNEFFIYPTSSKSIVYNLKGEKVLEFKYVPEDGNMYNYNFIKIRHSVYGGYNGVLMKAIGEREALEDFGLLFTPTTGTANDSRVRIREYALLEAKNLGYLTVGDKLEILDRSGVKVKIGDMEDYWYKIRRISDGIEGWSYGEFIDIDGEENNIQISK